MKSPVATQMVADKIVEYNRVQTQKKLALQLPNDARASIIQSMSGDPF